MNAARQTLLIQFTKAPSAGEVKTRLAPALSDAQRNDLHRAMTEWLCQTLRRACDGYQLWVTGDGSDAFIDGLRRQYRISIHKQAGADLGQRMSQAIAQGLQDYQQVLIVGSDCPFVDRDYIDAALKELAACDIVIGPANDGGYVLLGVKRLLPALFADIAWGTGQVLEQTVAAAEHQNLSMVLLPARNDIDQPEDLITLDIPQLPDQLARFAAFAP